MSLTGCLVIEGLTEWTIVVGDQVERLASDVSLSELSICANLMIGRAGLKNPEVVLAPASNSCFFCSLSGHPGLDIRDRQSLLYELENQLPWDAESMVADFVMLPDVDDPRIVSVAIELSRWQAIVESFEASDLQVRAIVPAAVLAAHGICTTLATNECVEVFLVDGEFTDVMTVANATVLSWKHLPLDPQVIGRHRQLNRGSSDRTMVSGLDSKDESVVQVSQIEWLAEHREAFTVTAQLCLDRPAANWFDLRRDALAPSDPWRAINRQLRWLAVATAACLLALVVGGWWREHRIRAEVAAVQNEQTRLFQAAYPGSRVPVAMLRRVRNEHAQVLGSRGQSTEVEVPSSAPLILRTFLGALPKDVRYRITRIEIRDGEVSALLQVRTVEDAGGIAAAIDEAGFDVAPPGTHQLEAGTIESELRATWQPVTSESPEATG